MVISDGKFSCVMAFAIVACCAVTYSAPSSGPAGARIISEDQAERIFERFVRESSSQAVFPPSGPDDFGDHLAEKIDLIAEQLDIETEDSEDLRAAITLTIHANEFLQSETESQALTEQFIIQPARKRPRYRFARPRKMSLLDALEPEEERNPFILHAINLVDFDRVKAETISELDRMPSRDKKLLSNVASEVVSLEDAGRLVSVQESGSFTPVSSVSPMRAIVRLVASVINHGVNIMDRFYQAPEFITNIPIIGKHLHDLKLKGEPLYHMISFVRHSAYLLRFSGIYSKLGSQKKMNESSVDNHRMTEAKKMISKVGAIALKSVAHKAIKDLGRKTISEDDMQEFVSRTFYAILTSLIPIGSTSLIRPR